MVKVLRSIVAAGLLSASLSGCALLPGSELLPGVHDIPGLLGSGSTPPASPTACDTPNSGVDVPAELLNAPWQSGKVFVVDRVYTLPTDLQNFSNKWFIYSNEKSLPGGSFIADDLLTPARLKHGPEQASFGTVLVNNTLKPAPLDAVGVWFINYPAVSAPDFTAKPELIVLPKGVRFGTPAADVIKAYGEPTSRKGGDWRWQDKSGRTVMVNIENGVVSGVGIGTLTEPPVLTKLRAETKAKAPSDPRTPSLAFQGQMLKLPLSVKTIESMGWKVTTGFEPTYHGPVAPNTLKRVRFEHPGFLGEVILTAGNPGKSPTKWSETPIYGFELSRGAKGLVFEKVAIPVAIGFFPKGITLGSSRTAVEQAYGKPLDQGAGNRYYRYKWGKTYLDVRFKGDVVDSLGYILGK